jgi:beta-lactam-binding protein with PASTA domain
MLRTLASVCVVGLILNPIAKLTAAPPDAALSQSEQEALKTLDPELAAECLKLAAEVESWRKELEQFQKAVKAARVAAAGKLEDALRDEQCKLVVKIGQELLKRSPEFRELIALSAKVEQQIQAYERKTAERKQAAVALADELTKAVETLRSLQNPARFARDFLESEVKAKYLNEPYDFGDIRLRITQRDFRKSLFSPDADLTVSLEYSTIGYEVKARGLYFQYRAGELPRVCTDKMKVETSSLDALANTAIKSLGDALPDWGLPIQIKNPRVSGFDDPDPSKRGALSFRVVVSFGELFDIKPANLISAEGDVTVHLNGKVELGPDGIKAGIQIKTPLPPTPFMLDGYVLQLRPQNPDKQVTIGTWLATSAGKEALSLKVEISIGFPITTRGITIVGTLLCANVEIGTIEARITKEAITGKLRLPSEGSPIPKSVVNAEFDMRLDKTGFVSKGMASLFSLAEMQMDMMLKFDGEASLTAKQSLKLLGSAVDSNLDIKIEKGFKRAHLQANLMADVDLKFRRVKTSVAIDAMWPRRPAVFVKARSAGMEVNLELDDLAPAELQRRLAEEFLKQADQWQDMALEALADLEKDGHRLLAKADKQFRDDLARGARNAGLDRVSTGNPVIDQRLGELAKDGKYAIAWGAKSREKSGQWLSDVRQNPGGTLTGSLKSLQADLSDLGSKLSEELDPTVKRRQREKKKKLEEEIAKAELQLREHQEREKAADDQLRALVQALNGGAGVIDRPAPPVKPGEPRPERVTALRIDCENAVSDVVDGTKDGMVAFLFYAQGFAVGPNGRRSDSEVKSGTIRFSQLLDPRARPRARIQLPNFRHGSELPAYQLLFDRLADLIERLVPGCEVEGRQYEKFVVVENTTQEKVRVWVQAETRLEGRADWRWLPAGPGSAAHAYSLVLAPGERRQVERETEGARGSALSARRIRYWAESENGRIWNGYASQDLWMVPPAPPDGRRYYSAATKLLHVVTLTPSDGKRTPGERVVLIRNRTTHTLSVWAQADAVKSDGALASSTAGPVTIEPGAVALMRKSDGWMLRGTSVKVWANDQRDQALRWLTYKTQSLGIRDTSDQAAETPSVVELVFEIPTVPTMTTGDNAARRLVYRLPADTVHVPALVRRTAVQAEAALTAIGLRWRYPTAAMPTDTVIAVHPNQWVATKSEVSLTTAVDVPPVKDLSAQIARDRLEKLQIGVRTRTVQRPTTDANLVGRVLVASQSAVGPKPRPVSVDLELISYVVATVRVPPLSGLTWQEAEPKLRHAGLKWRWLNTPEGGRVEGTAPAAGTEVRIGDTVVVRFPAPRPKQIQAPDLVGLSLEAARTQAQALGLHVRVAGSTTSPESNPAFVNKNSVTRQGLPAGQLVNVGTTIDVHMVTFVPPPAPKQVQVPFFVEDSIEAARNRANALGLRVRVAGSSTRPASNPGMVNMNMVRSQGIPAGQLVLVGTTIDVHVVTFVAPPPPRQVNVPSFIDDTLPTAQARAAALGLRVRVVSSSTRPAANPGMVNRNMVTSQGIPAGQLVNVGTTIDVQMVTFIAPRLKG